MVRYGIALVIIFSHPAFGQSLTLKQYFKSSLEDGLYKSFDNQERFLQNKSEYSLPWVNKVQALYQDNQFNNFQTRYTLRFYPGNPFQIQRNSQYFQGYQALKNLEQKLHLKEILRKRYDLAVEFWMTSEIANLTASQKKMQEKISETMERLSGSANFDATQFLNTQLEIISKETDWQELNLARDVIQSKILINSTEATFTLPFSELIDLEQIRNIVYSQSKGDRTEYNFLKQRVEVGNLKTKLEKSNFDIGYLQTMYGSDRRLDRQNTIGLAFGVALPIINPNKENIAREKLTTMERQGELEQFQQQENAKIQNARANLLLHLNHYARVDSLITAVKDKNMNLIATLSNNYNPIIELKYQEKLIQLETLKLKIKRQILIQYISFIDNSDKLHERPLVNYLSRTLESVEE